MFQRGVQAATGLPRATAHRLATALEAHHMVRRDQAGRFCLGFELIHLGAAATAGFPLAELATPALTVLRDRTGESVQLFVREHGSRRCVVSLQSSHALQWVVPEGALLPLEFGSAGKVLAGVGAPRLAESVEERERGTLEQLIVTPIGKSSLMLGKLVPFVIVGYIQMTVVLSMGRIFFRVPMMGNVGFLFLSSGIFLLTGLGPGWKAEDLDDAMRQEQQTGDDPERCQGAGRPAIHLIEHSLSSPF